MFPVYNKYGVSLSVTFVRNSLFQYVKIEACCGNAYLVSELGIQDHLAGYPPCSSWINVHLVRASEHKKKFTRFITFILYLFSVFELLEPRLDDC